jgi:hypothetical protein
VSVSQVYRQYPLDGELGVDGTDFSRVRALLSALEDKDLRSVEVYVQGHWERGGYLRSELRSPGRSLNRVETPGLLLIKLGLVTHVCRCSAFHSLAGNVIFTQSLSGSQHPLQVFKLLMMFREIA